MLDAFIIEEIRRRKEQEHREQPSIQLPLPEPIEPLEKPREQTPPQSSPIIIEMV
jgi:hypothetical protein